MIVKSPSELKTFPTSLTFEHDHSLLLLGFLGHGHGFVFILVEVSLEVAGHLAVADDGAAAGHVAGQRLVLGERQQQLGHLYVQLLGTRLNKFNVVSMFMLKDS